MASSGASNDYRELWYYDACALEFEFIIREITENQSGIKACISHLGLGEAFGNCHLKDKRSKRVLISVPFEVDRNKMSAFVDLMENLTDYLKVVGNDGVEEILQEIRTQFPDLGLTDSIHLATAIKHQCSIFRTTDPDFNGIANGTLKSICTQFGLKPMRIRVTEFPKKKNS